MSTEILTVKTLQLICNRLVTKVPSTSKPIATPILWTVLQNFFQWPVCFVFFAPPSTLSRLFPAVDCVRACTCIYCYVLHPALYKFMSDTNSGVFIGGHGGPWLPPSKIFGGPKISCLPQGPDRMTLLLPWLHSIVRLDTTRYDVLLHQLIPSFN